MKEYIEREAVLNKFRPYEDSLDGIDTTFVLAEIEQLPAADVVERSKVLSNADRIRAMSDEELAWELIVWRDDWGDYETHVGCFDEREDALRAEIEWLKQPVEEDS